MEWELIGKLLVDVVSGLSATIGIGQFVYAITRSKKDLREIQQKSELGDESIYSDRKQRRSLKEVYRELAKTEPYAQRVILALQVRAGIILLVTILTMYGLVSGLLLAGPAIYNNLMASIVVMVVFILIVNKLIPNMLFGFRGKVVKIFDDKTSDKNHFQKYMSDLKSEASKRVTLLMKTVGVGSVTPSEISLMQTYVTTLEMVRAIEAEELRGALQDHQKTLEQWNPGASDDQNA